MSVTATAHLHPETAMVTAPSLGDRGYIRIQTEGDSSFGNSISVHGNAAEMRRLARAATALADELDGTNARRTNALYIEAYGQLYPEDESA